MKFLGIIISDTLVWDEHIKFIVNKLSKISGSLYKLTRCIPGNTRKMIYFALINSQGVIHKRCPQERGDGGQAKADTCGHGGRGSSKSGRPHLAQI